MTAFDYGISVPRWNLKAFARDQPIIRAFLLRAGALIKSLENADPGVYTLCYHHVRSSAAASFRQQLLHFKSFGDFIDADTALEWLASGEALRRKGFVLTFDDGYADNIDVALPILESLQIPAMLFMVSDWVERPPVGPGVQPRTYMTRSDVGTWVKAGFAIGSHSATHRRFSLLDEATASNELAHSREVLSEMAGRPVTHFACPWGVADADYLRDRDPKLASRSGYRTFFTTRRGTARSDTDLLSMPRHVMEPEWPVYQIEALLGERRHVRG